jgi:P27 family predicted phage terminase small subunit
VLSAFDLGAVAVYCAAFGHWLEATDAIEKYGMVVKSPNGFPMQAPHVSIANKSAELMIRLGNELGFTPSSRSRIFTFDQRNSMLLEPRELDETLL